MIKSLLKHRRLRASAEELRAQTDAAFQDLQDAANGGMKKRRNYKPRRAKKAIRTIRQTLKGATI